MSQAVSLSSVIVRSPDVISTNVDTGEIILSIDQGKYYGVTAVGQRIWHLIATPLSLSAVCDQLMAEYEIDRAACEAQVLKFVQNMAANGIVQITPAPQ